MNVKKEDLLPVAKGDKLVQVMTKQPVHWDGESRYHTYLVVQPKDRTILSRAFPYFIDEDGKPELKICMTQPCGICRGYIENNIENCRYAERNMHKKVAYFYTKLPANISKEKLERMEKNSREVIESKRRNKGIYLD